MTVSGFLSFFLVKRDKKDTGILGKPETASKWGKLGNLHERL